MNFFTHKTDIVILPVESPCIMPLY